MTSIKKEIPTWTIDWNNKTFTLANIPSQVDDLWLDWAIYVDFIINWNILTLTDAPTYNLFIDYDIASVNPITTSQDTFWDIKQEIWDLLWQTSNSTTFSSAKLWKKINSKIKEVLRWRITSLLDLNRIYRCWAISFMTNTFYIRTAWMNVMTDVLNVWDTEAICSTVNLYPAWYVMINWEIIKYTSLTSTTLEWVSWNVIKHYGGEKITQLYEMPWDMEKPNEVYYMSWNEKIEIPFSDTETPWVCYNIIWTKKLLKIIWLEYNKIIRIDYTKVLYNLVNDTDLCVLPDNYGTEVIAPLIAGNYALTRGIPTAQSILLNWYTNLQNMYQFFTNKITITKQSIKPQSYKFNR